MPNTVNEIIFEDRSFFHRLDDEEEQESVSPDTKSHIDSELKTDTGKDASDVEVLYQILSGNDEDEYNFLTNNTEQNDDGSQIILDEDTNSQFAYGGTGKFIKSATDILSSDNGKNIEESIDSHIDFVTNNEGHVRDRLFNTSAIVNTQLGNLYYNGYFEDNPELESKVGSFLESVGFDAESGFTSPVDMLAYVGYSFSNLASSISKFGLQTIGKNLDNENLNKAYLKQIEFFDNMANKMMRWGDNKGIFNTEDNPDFGVGVSKMVVKDNNYLGIVQEGMKGLFTGSAEIAASANLVSAIPFIFVKAAEFAHSAKGEDATASDMADQLYRASIYTGLSKVEASLVTGKFNKMMSSTVGKRFAAVPVTAVAAGLLESQVEKIQTKLEIAARNNSDIVFEVDDSKLTKEEQAEVNTAQTLGFAGGGTSSLAIGGYQAKQDMPKIKFKNNVKEAINEMRNSKNESTVKVEDDIILDEELEQASGIVDDTQDSSVSEVKIKKNDAAPVIKVMEKIHNQEQLEEFGNIYNTLEDLEAEEKETIDTLYSLKQLELDFDKEVAELAVEINSEAKDNNNQNIKFYNSNDDMFEIHKSLLKEFSKKNATPKYLDGKLKRIYGSDITFAEIFDGADIASKLDSYVSGRVVDRINALKVSNQNRNIEQKNPNWEEKTRNNLTKLIKKEIKELFLNAAQKANLTTEERTSVYNTIKDIKITNVEAKHDIKPQETVKPEEEPKPKQQKVELVKPAATVKKTVFNKLKHLSKKIAAGKPLTEKQQELYTKHVEVFEKDNVLLNGTFDEYIEEKKIQQDKFIEPDDVALDYKDGSNNTKARAPKPNKTTKQVSRKADDTVKEQKPIKKQNVRDTIVESIKSKILPSNKKYKTGTIDIEADDNTKTEITNIGISKLAKSYNSLNLDDLGFLDDNAKKLLSDITFFFRNDLIESIGKEFVKNNVSIDKSTVTKKDYDSIVMKTGASFVQSLVEQGYVSVQYLDAEEGIIYDNTTNNSNNLIPILSVNKGFISVLADIMVEEELESQESSSHVGIHGKVDEKVRRRNFKASKTKVKAAKNQAKTKNVINKDVLEAINYMYDEFYNETTGEVEKGSLLFDFLGLKDSNNLHISRRKNNDSRNQSITLQFVSNMKYLRALIDSHTDLDNINDLGLFFDHYIMSNGRVSNDSKFLNRMTDKLVSRYLLEFSEQGTMKNELDMKYFIIGALQGLDEHKYKYNFDDMAGQFSVMLDEVPSHNNVINILKFMQDNKLSGSHVFQTLTEMSRLREHMNETGSYKGFKTSLTIEADGVTNAYSISMAQSLSNTKDNAGFFNSIGVFASGVKNDIANFMGANNSHDTNLELDVYEKTVDLFEKEELGGKNVNRIALSLKNSGIHIDRSMSKAPSMHFIYSSGKKSIAKFISNVIYDKMIDRIESGTAETLIPIFSEIGIDVNEIKKMNSANKNYQVPVELEAKIKNILVKSIGNPFYDTLNRNYGKISSGVQKGVKKNLAKKIDMMNNYIRKAASKKDITLARYEEILKRAEEALYEKFDDDIGIISYSKFLKEYGTNKLYYRTDDDTQLTTVQTHQEVTPTFSHYLPISNHNVDGAIAAKVLEEYSSTTMQVYDAFIATVGGKDSIVDVVKKANQSYYEVNKNNRIFERISGQKIPFANDIGTVQQYTTGLPEERFIIADDKQGSSGINHEKLNVTNIAKFKIGGRFGLADTFKYLDDKSDAHSKYLKNLAATIISYVHETDLDINQIDGSTHGAYSLNMHSLEVNIQRQAKDLFTMDELEVFTHELFHASTEYAFRNNQRLQHNTVSLVKEIVASMEKNGGYKLLIDNSGVDEKADEDNAKFVWDYIKNNPSEFITYYATNKKVKDAVDSTVYNTDRKKINSLLLKILDYIRNLFNRRTTPSKDLNTLIKKLHNANLQAAETVSVYKSETNDKLGKVLNGALDKASSSSMAKKISGLADKNDIISSIKNEMTGSLNDWKDYNKIARKVITAMRNYEADKGIIKKWVKNKLKNLSKLQSRTLKLSLFDTGIYMTTTDINLIKEYLGNDELVKGRIAELESVIRQNFAGNSANYVITQTNALGYYLSTGIAPVADMAINEYAINDLVTLTNKQPRKSSIDEIRELVSLNSILSLNPIAKSESIAAIENEPEAVSDVVNSYHEERKVAGHKLLKEYPDYNKYSLPMSFSKSTKSNDYQTTVISAHEYTPDKASKVIKTFIAGNGEQFLVVKRNTYGVSITSGSLDLMRTFLGEQKTSGITEISNPSYSRPHKVDLDNVKRYPVNQVSRKGKVIGNYMPLSKKEGIVGNEETNMIADAFAENISGLERQASSVQLNKVIAKLLEDDFEQNSINHPDLYEDIGVIAQSRGIDPEIIPNYLKGSMIRKDYADVILGYRDLTATSLLDKEKSKLFRIVGETESFWKDVVGVGRLRIAVLYPSVFVANIFSNIGALAIEGLNPFSKKNYNFMLEGIYGIENYFRDINMLREMQLDNRANSSVSKEDVTAVRNRLANNPVARYIDLGLFSSIIEDVDVDEIHKNNKFLKKIDKAYNLVSAQVKKFPAGSKEEAEALMDVGKEAYISKSSSIFGILNKVTQYADFIARYTMIKALVEKGVNEEDAIEAADKRFIKYDMNEHRAVKYANDTGLWMFTKFKFRSKPEVLKMTASNPIPSAILLATEFATTDIPTMDDNFVTNLTTGMFQQDSVIEAITSLPLTK